MVLQSAGHCVDAYRSRAAAQVPAGARIDEIACQTIEQRMPGGTELEIIADLRARDLMMRTLLITGTHDADTACNAQGLDGMTIH